MKRVDSDGDEEEEFRVPLENRRNSNRSSTGSNNNNKSEPVNNESIDPNNTVNKVNQLFNDSYSSLTDEKENNHNNNNKHKHDHIHLSWNTSKSFDVEIKDLKVCAKVPIGKIPIPGLTKYDTLTILDGLTDIRVPAGCFLAILGTSGSGKTTLLNTLAGRSEDLEVEGSILFNGHKVTRSEAKQSVGYVMQSDQLLPNLTVRETLRYAGLLRLPSDLSHEEKIKIVDELIGELALRDCADRIIGGIGRRGISGGEARRVSIAIQMLSNPGVLFLDEPSSGLDSFTAHNLVSTLLSLSRHNKTVICTIHQPRSDIFNMFDYVLLLSKGRVVYFGQTKHIISHFQSLGYDCPLDVNPSDYFLDLITINYQTEELELESKERLQTLVQGYTTSPMYQSGMHTTDQTPPPESRKFEIESRNTNFLAQIWLLYHRSVVNMTRDRSVVMARLVETVLIALICGGMFYQLGYDLEGIKSRTSCFYIVVILQPYLIIIANILQFSEELLVYDREHYDGMYATLPFWLATKAATLPLELVSALIFSAIFYWMTGLRQTIEHFAWFSLIMFMAQYTSASLGFMAASIFRSFAGASLMANLLMTFWAITTGFIINPATFVFYMRWIAYTSLYQFSYGGLASNELRGNKYPCPYPETDVRCLLYDGDDILARLQLRTDDPAINTIILVGIATFFNLISLAALRYITHRPK